MYVSDTEKDYATTLVQELRMNGFHYVEIGELLDISPRRVGAISRQIMNVVRGKINQYYFK